MQITDLPSDPNTQLVSIRAPLVSTINSARHSGSKAELLYATLKVALAEVEKLVEKPTEAPTVDPEPKPTKKAPAKKKIKQATAKVDPDAVT